MRNKIVHFYPKYTSAGPSSRYRTYQYINLFQEHFDVVVFPLFDDNYVGRLFSNRRKFNILGTYLNRLLNMIKSYFYADIIFVEKEFFPYLPLVCEKWIFLKKKNNFRF